MVKFRSQQDLIYVSKDGRKTIGKGAFGNVKRIKHKEDRSTVYALKIMKILNPTEMKYIMKEIELHKSLEHLHIIACKDYFIEDELTFVILEYAPRGDLFKYMLNNPEIPKHTLLRIFVQTLTAFEYLHKKNILHRDLKPENILLDENLNVKVCDFGWSAEYSDYEIRDTICGTAEYMAPEVIYKHKQTKKTDVWALGTITAAFAFFEP